MGNRTDSSVTLAFIGGGNMATSLISGLVADGHDPKRILVSDLEHERLAALSARFGVKSTADNLEAAKQADVVILAVKPQILQTVCIELQAMLQKQKPLIISIAAGVCEAHLQQWLGGNLPLVRTMPNTPAMLQTGATVLYANNAMVSNQQRNLAESVMRAVGLTCWIKDEAQMDAVTALSGSGPAYLFLVMEAMEQAGIELGLDPRTAQLLTIQTALGAAKMAMESNEPPAMLKERVTSRGGTTEKALEIFENGGLRTLFSNALAGAKARSEELSSVLGVSK
ncbi:pyrroline-5-carboxylate reductase [Achromatium sp. WMS1]|nr:pyrroline-5-carboxylate reductase [Achromatium sp. WMS1]